MKSRVHPKYKTKYGVKNWASYDRALVQRGDITIWLSPDAIATWKPAGVGRRGGQRKYSNLAIETALTLRLIFNLPLRQTEGFLNSLFVMMGLDPSAPDHTTLSRRGQHLDVELRRVAPAVSDGDPLRPLFGFRAHPPSLAARWPAWCRTPRTEGRLSGDRRCPGFGHDVRAILRLD